MNFCQVVWAIKDDYIGNTFFDAAASEFFLKTLESNYADEKSCHDTKSESEQENVLTTLMKDLGSPTASRGVGLGPNWARVFDQVYYNQTNEEGERKPSVHKQTYPTLKNVTIEYCCEILDIQFISAESNNFPIRVRLSNGTLVECDFVVSATGVLPNIEFVGDEIQRAHDGSLLVDESMMTSIDDVYAAGDCCWVNLKNVDSQHWFQMRLWSQARFMGILAAYSMYNRVNRMHSETYSCLDPPIGLAFDIFSHATYFFGFKVILLGLYNGQGLRPDEYHVLIRYTLGKEYIKVVIKEGKMQGALLIGDTDLEETCENLILNQLDLSGYGEQLLDPSIDIEDYFD